MKHVNWNILVDFLQAIKTLSVGEVSPDWSGRLMAEKFRFHNAQWIEMVQSQQFAEFASLCPVSF